MLVKQIEAVTRAQDPSKNVYLEITYSDEVTDTLQIDYIALNQITDEIKICATSSKKIVSAECKQQMKDAICALIDSVGE